jgi:hypothetical protein
LLSRFIVSRSLLRRLEKRIHLSFGSFQSATTIFGAASTVAIGLAHLSARLTPFRLAHPALLIEILLAGGKHKRPAAVSAFNLFISHLELSFV